MKHLVDEYAASVGRVFLIIIELQMGIGFGSLLAVLEHMASHSQIQVAYQLAGIRVSGEQTRDRMALERLSCPSVWSSSSLKESFVSQPT